MYFVTICTKDREKLFGKIENGEMILNELGKIVKKCYLEIPNHFSNIYLDKYVIMPNHVHGIIEIIDNKIVDNAGSAYMRSGNTDKIYSGNANRTKMLLSKTIQGFKAAVTRMENGMNNKRERVYAFPTIW